MQLCFDEVNYDDIPYAKCDHTLDYNHFHIITKTRIITAQKSNKIRTKDINILLLILGTIYVFDILLTHVKPKPNIIIDDVD